MHLEATCARLAAQRELVDRLCLLLVGHRLIVMLALLCTQRDPLVCSGLEAKGTVVLSRMSARDALDRTLLDRAQHPQFALLATDPRSIAMTESTAH